MKVCMNKWPILPMMIAPFMVLASTFLYDSVLTVNSNTLLVITSALCRYSRHDKRSKLPSWILSHLHDAHLNLSTDMALHIAREVCPFALFCIFFLSSFSVVYFPSDKLCFYFILSSMIVPAKTCSLEGSN